MHFYYMYKYIIFKGIRKFESSVIFCNGPFIFHVFPKLFFFYNLKYFSNMHEIQINAIFS